LEVCGDSGIMENFGGSDLTAYNKKEGKIYMCARDVCLCLM